MKSFFLSTGLLLTSFFTYAQPVSTLTSADGTEVTIADASRIITIGGSMTEIVYALGFGKHVISVDASSTYPPQIHRLPKVPYIRNLTAEGILSLRPTLVITTDEAEPKSAIDQMRAAKTTVLTVADKESVEGMIHKIAVISKALGAEEKGDELIAVNKDQLQQAASIRASLSKKPKIMFVLAQRGATEFTVAGKNTAAQKVIELAGATNAFYDFDGYKPVTGEAMIAAKPDFILFMSHRKPEIEPLLRKQPAINLVTAVKEGNLIDMDGNYILGFGPRLGTAVLDLMKLIHPDPVVSPN